MTARGAPTPLVRAAPGDRDRLSYGQQRLWFIDRVMPGTPLYNEPLVLLELVGPLVIDAVRASVDYLVARHEVLRTVFVDGPDGPITRILPASTCAIAVHDLRDVARVDERLQAMLDAEATRSFDLARGPLIEVSLVRIADERHVLIVALHHIVSDGWSTRVLLRELAAVYRDAVRCLPLGRDLPVLAIQYADYAWWQRTRIARGELADDEAYWRARLAGAPGVLAWPADLSAPGTSHLAGAFVQARLALPTLDRLRAATGAALHDDAGPVTRFMVLLAAWLIVLHHRTGSLDLCVGTAVAGRVRQELEPLLGFFVNVLVLRTSLAGNPSFQTLIARTRETVLGALAHQELPFDHLVDQLGIERRDSLQPLVNVFFAYHNFQVERHVVDGLRIERLRHDRSGAKFDVALLAVEGEEADDTLTLQLWFDAEQYTEPTMRAALAEVCRLVEQLGPERIALPLMAIDRLVGRTTDLSHDGFLDHQPVDRAGPSEEELPW